MSTFNASRNDVFEHDARLLQIAPVVHGDAANRRSISQVEEPARGHQPIGASVAWRGVLKRAQLVAAAETTTCLHGESGTGKEVVARYIHARSRRRHGPFVAINCAALPDQLLESELFGYERGAFTGAQQSKPGQIELAAGGTLFLDEVTEMTPTAQAKFLRVLQEREFLRLGGTRPIKTNVRLVAATNRNLRDAVARGQFRADVFYRVNVFSIDLPPLRERRDDIPVLAAAFLQEFAHAMGKRPAKLTPEALSALVDYEWPGNVRELRNVIECATILCEDGLIHLDDLSLWGAMPSLVDSTDLDVLERNTIERVMREVDGNKAKAARKLRLSRTQLYFRLRKYGLDTSRT